jgi:hypothetical protein
MTSETHEQPYYRHALAGVAVVIFLLAVLGLAV